MSNLTMPTLTVAFKQRASTTVARSQKGVVAFLIRDAAADAADLKYTLTSSAQIPQTLGTANQAAIRRVFLGNGNPPQEGAAVRHGGGGHHHGGSGGAGLDGHAEI